MPGPTPGAHTSQPVRKPEVEEVGGRSVTSRPHAQRPDSGILHSRLGDESWYFTKIPLTCKRQSTLDGTHRLGRYKCLCHKRSMGHFSECEVSQHRLKGSRVCVINHYLPTKTTLQEPLRQNGGEVRTLEGQHAAVGRKPLVAHKEGDIRERPGLQKLQPTTEHSLDALCFVGHAALKIRRSGSSNSLVAHKRLRENEYEDELELNKNTIKPTVFPRGCATAFVLQ